MLNRKTKMAFENSFVWFSKWHLYFVDAFVLSYVTHKICFFLLGYSLIIK